MKRSIHLNFDPCLFASRVRKEAHTLLEHKVFEEVIIVATKSDSQATVENVENGVWIKRLNTYAPLSGGRLPSILSRLFTYGWEVFFVCKNFTPDNITAHGVFTLPFAVLYSKLFSTTLVYDCHELEAHRNGMFGFKRKFIAFIERILIRFCDRVIVVNHSIKEYYESTYGITPHVVMNTPLQVNNIERIRPFYFQDLYELPRDYKIFLYQGGFNKGRGIELMCEAFKSVQGQKVALIFMGYGALESYIKEQASKHLTIYYHQAVPQEKLLAYTKCANFGISVLVFKETASLSYYYCLPNKFFEYSMAGLLTIGSNIPEYRKIINEYGNGVILEDDNPESLKKVIFDIMERKFDSESYTRMISNYNWQKQEEFLLNAYQ